MVVMIWSWNIFDGRLCFDGGSSRWSIWSWSLYWGL